MYKFTYVRLGEEKEHVIENVLQHNFCMQTNRAFLTVKNGFIEIPRWLDCHLLLGQDYKDFLKEQNTKMITPHKVDASVVENPTHDLTVVEE